MYINPESVIYVADPLLCGQIDREAHVYECKLKELMLLIELLFACGDARCSSLRMSNELDSHADFDGHSKGGTIKALFKGIIHGMPF